MNLIDLYLKMNSCERDTDNNIYFISPSTNEKKVIGVLEGYDVQEGTFKVYIKKFKENTKFLNLISEEVIVNESEK